MSQKTKSFLSLFCLGFFFFNSVLAQGRSGKDDRLLTLNVSESDSSQNLPPPRIRASSLTTKDSSTFEFEIQTHSEPTQVNIEFDSSPQKSTQSSSFPLKFSALPLLEVISTERLEWPSGCLRNLKTTGFENTATPSVFVSQIFRMPICLEKLHWFKQSPNVILFEEPLFFIAARVPTSAHTRLSEGFALEVNLQDRSAAKLHIQNLFLKNFLIHASMPAFEGVPDTSAPAILKNSTKFSYLIEGSKVKWLIRFQIQSDYSDKEVRAVVEVRRPDNTYMFFGEAVGNEIIPSIHCTFEQCVAVMEESVTSLIAGRHSLYAIDLYDNFKNKHSYTFQYDNEYTAIEVSSDIGKAKRTVSDPVEAFLVENSSKLRIVNQTATNISLALDFNIDPAVSTEAYVFIRGPEGRGGDNGIAKCTLGHCALELELPVKRTNRGQYYLGSVSIGNARPTEFNLENSPAKIFLQTPHLDLVAPQINFSTLDALVSNEGKFKKLTLSFDVDKEASDLWIEGFASLVAPNGKHAAFASKRCIENHCTLTFLVEKENLVYGVYYVDSISIYDSFYNGKHYEFSFGLAGEFKPPQIVITP